MICRRYARQIVVLCGIWLSSSSVLKAQIPVDTHLSVDPNAAHVSVGHLGGRRVTLGVPIRILLGKHWRLQLDPLVEIHQDKVNGNFVIFPHEYWRGAFELGVAFQDEGYRVSATLAHESDHTTEREAAGMYLNMLRLGLAKRVGDKHFFIESAASIDLHLATCTRRPCRYPEDGFSEIFDSDNRSVGANLNMLARHRLGPLAISLAVHGALIIGRARVRHEYRVRSRLAIDWNGSGDWSVGGVFHAGHLVGINRAVRRQWLGIDIRYTPNLSHAFD